MSFKYPALFTCRRRSSEEPKCWGSSEGRLLPSALSPPSFCCTRRAHAHSECRVGDTAPCPGNSDACAWELSAAQRPLLRERARTHLCLSPLWQEPSTSSVFIHSSTIIGWTSPSRSRPSVTTRVRARVHRWPSSPYTEKYLTQPPRSDAWHEPVHLTRRCRVWL